MVFRLQFQLQLWSKLESMCEGIIRSKLESTSMQYDVNSHNIAMYSVTDYGRPVIGQAIIFLPCGFFLLSSIYLSFFFSSPNLSGHRLDVYHTLTRGVALVRI